MWKFILIDIQGNETEVENPDGWGDVSVTLDRDDNWKGIFFGYLVDKLGFTGLGASLIKDEYEVNGVSGVMQMRVEFLCGDPGIYDLFYQGRLSFVQYHDECGDECSVTIGIEDTDDIMLMRNNYQVDVNLNSNVAFNGVTPLTNYSKLNFNLTIPSRGILQKSTGSNTVVQRTYLLNYPGWGNISGSGTGTEQGALMPVFANTPFSEVDNTSINPTPYYDSSVVFNNGVNTYPTPPFIDLVVDQALRCAPAGVRMQMRLKGRLIDTCSATRVVDLNAIIRVGQSAALTTLVDNQILATYSVNVSRTTEFDITFDQVLNLLPGDKVYVFDIITYQKLSSAPISNLLVEWDPQSFISFTGTSYCAPTTAKSYMINEAISRTIEAITNNGIKFYSTYFGRLDSQPYAIGNTPCPGSFAITNGLNMRRRLLPDDTQPGCFVTLKKLFDDLNGLYNIGLTIEPDLNRPGFNRLRFEDWRYFFQNDTGLIFRYATKIERDTDESRLFNQLVVGFNKWTAGQYTGLDEFMTKRRYRININAIDKELDVSTNLICSTYTIEITRRLDQTTEDWQYDNELFGLCLNEGYEIAKFTDIFYGSYGVVNVLDPDSCYNGRISPARSALNWFNYVIQGIRTLGDNSKLIFTKGEGNYIAEYGIKLCAVEGAELRENQTIEISSFEDVTDAKPITYPETIVFEHPLNWNTFRRILAEPDLKYKSIQVYCNGTVTEAWIKKLEYKPNEGMAKITAIPKNISIIPEVLPPAGCLAAITSGSVTLTGFNSLTGTAVVDFTESVAGATLWSYIITRGSTPGAGSGFSGNTTVHPFTVGGLTPGTWSVFIVPYCSPTEVGKNYASGTYNLPFPPAQSIQLKATRKPGLSDTFTITVTPVGGGVFVGGFSLNIGGCMTGPSNIQQCNGYPGSTNPNLFVSVFVNSGDTSVSVNMAAKTPQSGTLDSVTVWGLSAITAAQIQKAPGELWTLSIL